MAAKMGFLVALIVALSVGGSEAARTLADMQNKDYKGDSPALTHWQHALPTVSIPQTLKELISPFSSKETAETFQIIDKEKATATVTPNLFYHDYHRNVADAKSSVTPNLFYHDYHKNVADAKSSVSPNLLYHDYHKNVADDKLFDSKALCEKGNLDCKPAATVTPNLLHYNYHKNVADAK